MKKILLLNPPIFNKKKFIRSGYCNSISKGGYYWQPIDLAAQSGILKNNFEIEILDATAEGLDEKKTIKIICDKYPDIKNLFFITSLASKDYDFDFIQKLNNIINYEKILVSAGYLLFDNSSAFRYVDGVLLDYTSYETLIFFSNGKNEKYNTISTNNNTININYANKTAASFFEYGVPLHKKFPLNKYYMPNSKKLPMVNIITNLGCPYKCDFCTWSNLKYRQRKINNVIAELKYLNENNIYEIMFIDPTFGANKKYTFELLNAIIKEKIKIGYSIECRINLIDEEFVNLLHKTGCHSITFGLESGNDEILKNIGKGFTVNDIKQAFQLCHKYKIKPTGHFIIGLPGETKKTVANTIKLAKEIDCDYASFNIFMPLPGTEIYKKNNCKLNTCGDTEKPIINLTNLSDKEIYDLARTAFKSFYLRPSYILKRIICLMNLTQLKILFKEALFFLKRILMDH